jgi:hypothetical protein
MRLETNVSSVTETPVANAEREPETANAVYVRDLKLQQVALYMVPFLYAAARIDWPDHPDYPEEFHRSPKHVRDRLLQIAQQAIALVNEANPREADRQAELAFMRTFDDAVQTAKDLDRDHSRFHLVEDAFDRLRGLLHAVKPARIVVAVYRTALVKGGGR